MTGLYLYYYEAHIHGILFFSSRVYPAGGKARGTAEETAPYIHNYSLTYAVNGMPAEAYGVNPSLHYNSLGGAKKRGPVLQYPFIDHVLGCLVDPGCGRSAAYAYPAAPLRVRAQRFFMSIRTHSYGEFRGRLKTVYPRSATLIGLAPGSILKGFIASTRPLPDRIYTRIGMKRTGALLLVLREASVEGRLEGEAYTTHPVNIGDTLYMGYRLSDANVVLETRSIPFRGGRPCADCARVGYVKARGLYLVSYRVAARRRLAIIPLPPARVEAPPKPPGALGAVEPAW